MNKFFLKIKILEKYNSTFGTSMQTMKLDKFLVFYIVFAKLCRVHCTLYTVHCTVHLSDVDPQKL